MREARIIMPVTDDAHQTLAAHGRLEDALTEAFGGFTAMRGTGGWKDASDSAVRDAVVIYDVAGKVNADGPISFSGATEKLVAIATDAGRELGQKAVYIRYFDGVVEIVDVEQYFSERRQDEENPLLPQPGQIWTTKGGMKVAVVEQTAYKLLVTLLRDDANKSHFDLGARYAVGFDGTFTYSYEPLDNPHTLAKFTGVTF